MNDSDSGDGGADAMLGTTNFIFTGGENVIQAGTVRGEVSFHRRDPKSEDEDDLAIRRQAFLFDVYGQVRRQAEVTFRMSLIFMSIGALIIFSGGLLALLHFGAPTRSYVALFSGISGVVIGSCGGAFAVHANRARKHLAKQVDGLERDLRSDRRLAQTLRLIEQVDDSDLRDRLKSVVAMRVLDLNPNTEVITNRLLADKPESPKEIDSTDGNG